MAVSQNEAEARAAQLNSEPTLAHSKFVARKIGYFWEIEQYGPGRNWRILRDGQA